MSVPIGLPSNREDWLDEVNNRKLVGRTIHAADLASGSKIGYDQFLLLRVLWVSHKRVSVPERISDFLPSALELLAGCQSWKTYCDSFGTPKIPEGTFAMARHYQMKAANSKGNTRPDTFDTPIALRTRNMLKEQTTRVSRLHLDETPSKRSTNPPQTPVLPPSDDDSVLDDEEESPLLPSPITPAAQVPGELQKLMFPPTKDEQIVNTALLIFLSALTIHFDVSEMCEWTMHRKSFIPRFEGGSYEARTDGYLDDGQENAYALVEVKPVFRASKQTLIQMQESAQMVGWIKTDADEAKL
ncbi:hypothetical protein BO78DRAFT_426928 [Aspergillus terreus]|uniref:Uncharacterized protein n=1 Tax=Aspergillus terreus TaxID=33178 RepID=A0A5M3YP02_ASPTE|nr:hypothetical protein ATETN484_0002033300 [Aspergillus terreus]GFF15189.1 hypothetical protein BO78DRAFT_426928 [Aspergillus terreus]